MKWQFSLNQIIRDNWLAIKKIPTFNIFQLYHLNQLRKCRTAELGGHLLGCKNCGFYKIAYNSCRNRHCNCQAKKREEWMLKQEDILLNVPYFHVVFTLPSALNGLCLAHPRLMYTTLFRCAWKTLQTFAQDPKFLGAKTGATMVLHTWGQNLQLHPHVHCIVPGGGVGKDGKWKKARSNGNYFNASATSRKIIRQTQN